MQTPMDTQLGNRINAARQRKSARVGGYSLYRLAKDTKTDYSYLHRVIVRNLSQPSREKLIKICAFLDCTVEEAREIFDATKFKEPTRAELNDALRENEVEPSYAA